MHSDSGAATSADTNRAGVQAAKFIGRHGMTNWPWFKPEIQVLSWVSCGPENALVRYPAIVAFAFTLASTALAAEPIEVRIGYLRLLESKSAISLFDVPPDNDGIAGARLAIEDNNTTGKFRNQKFLLEDMPLKKTSDPAAGAIALAERGISIAIADMPADALLKAADAGRERGPIILHA